MADRHRRASGRPGDGKPPAIRAPALRLVRHRPAPPLALPAVQHHLDEARIVREETLHALDQRRPVGTHEDL